MSGKNQLTKWLIISIIGVIFGLVWFQPDQNLHLIACNIGQGDAILITQGSNQALVDGGPNESVLSCLSKYVPFWDRTIELIVLTNADADHMTGLIEVINRYDVDQLVTNHLFKDSQRFSAFRQTVIDHQVKIHAPHSGEVIQLPTGSDPVSFTVLWPTSALGNQDIWLASANDQVLGANTYGSNSNEQSVVLKLTYGDFDALLTGDIGTPTETALLESGTLTDIELLKVGHHGSKYSSTVPFLDTIKPEISLISTGKNSYGHPTPEAIERLKAIGSQIFRTDQDGDVHLITDGKKYWVKN